MKMYALLGILALVSATAWADSTVSGVTSTTDSSDSPSLLDHFYANYFAVIHGPSVNDMSSVHTVDRNGNPSAFPGVNLDSEITLSYLITHDIGVGPDIPFLLVPVLGEGIVMGDLGVKAFDRATVSSNGLWVYTNLYLQAPTSKLSQANGVQFGVKTTPAIRYTIPGSRFALGSWNELKWYAGATADRTFKVYTLPYVNYQLTRTLSANVGFEMEWHHNVGAPSGSLTPYQFDAQPGVVWNITPKVMFNPYLQFFTTQQVGWSTAAIGGVISATAL
jgi:hypothetical protein